MCMYSLSQFVHTSKRGYRRAHSAARFSLCAAILYTVYNTLIPSAANDAALLHVAHFRPSSTRLTLYSKQVKIAAASKLAAAHEHIAYYGVTTVSTTSGVAVGSGVI